MDTDLAILHDTTEELAAYLSEVTLAELRRLVEPHGRPLGALTLDLMHDHVRTAATVCDASMQPSEPGVPATTAELEASLNPDGTGVESAYRRVGRRLEHAFAEGQARTGRKPGSAQALHLARHHGHAIAGIVLHTWDVAQTLRLPYQPTTPVAWVVLRALTSPDREHGPDGASADPAPGPGSAVLDGEAFRSVLQLTGRAA